jgi:hypothetical protein
MDDWGPEEWAVAWQGAPAHVLQGRQWGGQGAGTSAAGSPTGARSSVAGVLCRSPRTGAS